MMLIQGLCFKPKKHLELAMLLDKEGDTVCGSRLVPLACARFINLGVPTVWTDPNAPIKTMVRAMQRGDVVVVNRSAPTMVVTHYSSKGVML